MEEVLAAIPRTVEVIIVRLPRTFYEDHQDRDLPSGSPQRWLKNQVDVELTWEEYEEILSDARHYASAAMDTWEGDFARSVKNSAKRTVAVLQRYGRHDFTPR